MGGTPPALAKTTVTTGTEQGGDPRKDQQHDSRDNRPVETATTISESVQGQIDSESSRAVFAEELMNMPTSSLRRLGEGCRLAKEAPVAYEYTGLTKANTDTGLTLKQVGTKVVIDKVSLDSTLVHHMQHLVGRALILVGDTRVDSEEQATTLLTTMDGSLRLMVAQGQCLAWETAKSEMARKDIEAISETLLNNEEPVNQHTVLLAIMRDEGTEATNTATDEERAFIAAIVDASRQQENIVNVMPKLLTLAFAIDRDARAKWQFGNIIAKAYEERNNGPEDKRPFTEILKWTLVDCYDRLQPRLKHLPLVPTNVNDASLEAKSDMTHPRPIRIYQDNISRVHVERKLKKSDFIFGYVFKRHQSGE